MPQGSPSILSGIVHVEQCTYHSSGEGTQRINVQLRLCTQVFSHRAFVVILGTIATAHPSRSVRGHAEREYMRAEEQLNAYRLRES